MNDQPVAFLPSAHGHASVSQTIPVQVPEHLRGLERQAFASDPLDATRKRIEERGLGPSLLLRAGSQSIGVAA